MTMEISMMKTIMMISTEKTRKKRMKLHPKRMMETIKKKTNEERSDQVAQQQKTKQKRS